MKAVIELDVPEWQIGQNVTVYFPDTMVKRGKCELLKEQEETVIPVKHTDKNDDTGWFMVWWGCPVCNFLLNGNKTRFCGGCGRSVKWK